LASVFALRYAGRVRPGARGGGGATPRRADRQDSPPADVGARLAGRRRRTGSQGVRSIQTHAAHVHSAESGWHFGVNASVSPLLQYRLPVGGGAPSNTCPWCPPQRARWYSVRGQTSRKSRFVPSAPGRTVVKLGGSVPLSNVGRDENSGGERAAHTKVPGRF
jgi:hypothetical protein